MSQCTGLGCQCNKFDNICTSGCCLFDQCQPEEQCHQAQQVYRLTMIIYIVAAVGAMICIGVIMGFMIRYINKMHRRKAEEALR